MILDNPQSSGPSSLGFLKSGRKMEQCVPYESKFSLFLSYRWPLDWGKDFQVPLTGPQIILLKIMKRQLYDLKKGCPSGNFCSFSS